jgi:hypothetical protein
MKRREFGGLVVTAIAGLFVSGAALVVGKKALFTNGSTSASILGADASPTETNKETPSIYGPNNTPFNPNSFYISVVTLFPYKMSVPEYKALVKGCRNIPDTDKLLLDMKTSGKLINIQSLLESDRVTSCFEFCNKEAFDEYQERDKKIQGNSPERKKALGFKTKIEYRKINIS